MITTASPQHVIVACALCVIAAVIAISIGTNLVWPDEDKNGAHHEKVNSIIDENPVADTSSSAESPERIMGITITWDRVHDLVDYADQKCDEACDNRNEPVVCLTESTRAATILATLRTLIDSDEFREQTQSLLTKAKRQRASLTSHLSSSSPAHPILSPCSSPLSSPYSSSNED